MSLTDSPDGDPAIIVGKGLGLGPSILSLHPIDHPFTMPTRGPETRENYGYALLNT